MVEAHEVIGAFVMERLDDLPLSKRVTLLRALLIVGQPARVHDRIKDLVADMVELDERQAELALELDRHAKGDRV